MDVYTVKADALTIPQSQVERAKEVLNWEEGIGSLRLKRTQKDKVPAGRNRYDSEREQRF